MTRFQKEPKHNPNGFKQTDIGLIPVDWEEIDFEATITKNNFSRVNLIPSSEFKSEGKYPIIDQGQEFIAGYTDADEKLYKIKEPVVLFGDHTRVFKYIDFPFVGGADGIKIFSPNPRLFEPKFYYYALTSLKIPSRGYNRHYKILKEKKVVKPPLPEQKKIAYVLSKIQQAIEVQEKIIKTTQEIKKALMQKLFTEGLNGEPQKQTEIGLIPESWEVKKIGEFCEIKTGGTPSRKIIKYWNGNIPWIKTTEVNYNYIIDTEEKITREGLENSSTKLIPKDTLLIAMYGQGITRGRVAITGIEATFNQACAAIFPKKEISTTEYLYYYLTYCYDYIRSLGHGANQRNLNTNIIRTVPIPLPSLDIQLIIVRFLKTLDIKINLAKEIFSSYKNFFNTSLNILITGKIRVKDIDFVIEENKVS